MAAFVAALFVWFTVLLVARIAESLTHFWVMPIPVVAIIACLVTVRVRSTWPVAALAALVIGFLVYVIAINTGSDTHASRVIIRWQIGSTIYLTGELAVGALAGWLWYRRESRFARPAATA